MKKVIPLQAQAVATTPTLNAQQLAAIQQLEGIHVINAGPGTGKSATLVARLCKLRAVYPSATVLMLAFSNSVFMVGLSDGVLPSSQEGADLAEEKRILYVGITRAKKRLYLSYPRLSDTTVEMNKPCRFIAGRF